MDQFLLKLAVWLQSYFPYNYTMFLIMIFLIIVGIGILLYRFIKITYIKQQNAFIGYGIFVLSLLFWSYNVINQIKTQPSAYSPNQCFKVQDLSYSIDSLKEEYQRIYARIKRKEYESKNYNLKNVNGQIPIEDEYKNRDTLNKKIDSYSDFYYIKILSLDGNQNKYYNSYDKSVDKNFTLMLFHTKKVDITIVSCNSLTKEDQSIINKYM